MSETVGGRPVWPLEFDKDGDVDREQLQTLIDEAGRAGLTDLVLFAHGWNTDEAGAQSLYKRWFALLAAQLDPDKKVGFVGIRWPAQLWRDEPIPDFDSRPPAVGGGAAAAEAAPTINAGAPTVAADQLADLETLFPEAKAQLDKVAELLADPPGHNAARELFAALRDFSTAAAETRNDGEAEASATPGVLDPDRDPTKVFETFAARLSDAGVTFTDPAGGAAGIGDFAGKILHGAKEALRQTTYWLMKNRAGVVGAKGVGPAINAVHEAIPDLRIHLIGHSFGARVVSFALAGLADTDPSPVKSLTLLQGAFSRFAFVDSLPFRPGERGALAGRTARVDGPVTVVFSKHDGALGTMYPLASAAAGDDAAAGEDRLFRWRAMGSHGAFRAPVENLGAVGHVYPFSKGAILNLDAAEIVRSGGGPAGAHSDIFHDQLAWVAASAGSLN